MKALGDGRTGQTEGTAGKGRNGKEGKWSGSGKRGKEDAITLLSDFLATPMPLGDAPATYFKTRVQATV